MSLISRLFGKAGKKSRQEMLTSSAGGAQAVTSETATRPQGPRAEPPKPVVGFAYRGGPDHEYGVLAHELSERLGREASLVVASYESFEPSQEEILKLKERLKDSDIIVNDSTTRGVLGLDGINLEEMIASSDSYAPWFTIMRTIAEEEYAQGVRTVVVDGTLSDHGVPVTYRGEEGMLVSGGARVYEPRFIYGTGDTRETIELTEEEGRSLEKSFVDKIREVLEPVGVQVAYVARSTRGNVDELQRLDGPGVVFLADRHSWRRGLRVSNGYYYGMMIKAETGGSKENVFNRLREKGIETFENKSASIFPSAYVTESAIDRLYNTVREALAGKE